MIGNSKLTTDADFYDMAGYVGETVSYEVHDSLLGGLAELGFISGEEHSLLGRGSCLEMISDEMVVAVVGCLGEMIKRIDKARVAGLVVTD